MVFVYNKIKFRHYSPARPIRYQQLYFHLKTYFLWKLLQGPQLKFMWSNFNKINLLSKNITILHILPSKTNKNYILFPYKRGRFRSIFIPIEFKTIDLHNPNKISTQNG